MGSCRLELVITQSAMKTILTAFTCFSAVLPFLSAAAADPESLGVVALADPPGPSPRLAELTAQLRAASAEETQGVLEARQLQERMGEVPTTSLSELDRAYSGALATHHSGDYERAIESLRAVIADLEKLPDGPEVFGQWTRAMLRLARAEASLGRKVEADEILDRLVRANPNVKVDLTQYPPSFQEQIDKRRAQLASLPKRKLEVTSQRKGVKVFVEGREVGTAPLTISVPPGRYRVSGAGEGVRLPARIIDLTSQDETVPLDFEVAEALRPGAGPGLALPTKTADDRARSVITAGAWLRLDRVLTARLEVDGGTSFLNAALYNVRRGALEREGTIRLGPGQLATPAALTELARFVIRNERCLSCVPADPRARSSKLEGWGSVGAGVLFLGLGGFAIYESINSQVQYNRASALLVDGTTLPADRRAEYDTHLRAGDAARTTAFITGGGAIVAAGVAGLLGYLSYKQSGEVGPFRF
jgi:tetratricopeptide (TPR) repeat protein